MESLFGDLEEEQGSGSSWLDMPEEGASDANDKERKRSSSGKDFSSDLQSFLQEAFDDSVERQLEERQQRDEAQPATPSVKKKHHRPMAGLDALIRSTVDPRPSSAFQDKRPKRVTLSFDPEKLEKLKAIAKSQRALLRDVIDEIVADYLNRLESEGALD